MKYPKMQKNREKHFRLSEGTKPLEQAKAVMFFLRIMFPGTKEFACVMFFSRETMV